MFSSKQYICFLCALVLGTHANAYLTVNPWQPIFRGVEHATGETDEPRLQKVTAVRVDLHDPDIRLITTPSNWFDPGDTTRQTASSYISSTGVQVAINGQYIDLATSYPYGDLFGLSMNEGEIVSPAQDLNALIGVNPGTLLVTQDNQAQIQQTFPSTDLTGVWTAVESWAYLLVNGVNTGDPRFIPGNIEPRFAVGLSQDGRYLILMTIDGRQSGYSLGATSYEESEWLQRFGAYNGINLDGGGSTHLWTSETGGSTYALNSPSENRAVGNHLGIYALPLDPPLLGDINLDGFVGIVDLNFLLSRWNQSVPKGDHSQGDLAGIGDGYIGIDDLNVVLGNWNAGTPPTDGAAIPEPATLVVMALSLPALQRRKRGVR
jgi:exopolysaccharide biosynthesis protein